MELWRPEVARFGFFGEIFAFVDKATPYWKIFEIRFRIKAFIATTIDVLCSFKFREIWAT